MQISLGDADVQLMDVVRQAQDRPVELINDGNDIAVVLSLEQYRRLTMSTRDSFHDLCARMSEYARSHGMNEQVCAAENCR